MPVLGRGWQAGRPEVDEQFSQACRFGLVRRARPAQTRAAVRSRYEYLDGLAAAGFVDAPVTFTTQAAPAMHSAIIRALEPATT